MKKLQILFILFFVTLTAIAQNIEDFLKAQPIVKSVEVIPGNSFFNETLKIMVRQPLDHSDTTKGFFQQRIFVGDKGKTNPVLLITEGYGAGRGAYLRFINELSPMLNSNQILVEHRYFGESWSDSVNWDYLTAFNAAEDHHAIVELFKKYYSGKWVNTGISKGGQTAVYHRTFFPDDVDVTVAYVAPLNFSVEDNRLEERIENSYGTPELREKIKQVQIEVLKRREKIYPMFDRLVKEKNYTFRIPESEVYDYCVLEYPFAFWQYGINTDLLPEATASDTVLFEHLFKISSPSYFSIEGMEGIKSFFVQAARELGYYSYNIKPLKKYLSIKTAKNYLSKIFLPADLKIKYNKNTALEVKKFINSTDADMMFIYGGSDPWYASGFEVPQKSNFLKIVKAGGSHSSRIKNLPPEQQKLVKEKMESWLGIPFYLDK